MTEKKLKLYEMPMAQEVGESFGIPSGQLINLIKLQIISVPSGEEPATDAELAIVLSTIRKTGLDPMLGQIHAWRDWKGKLAIMVAFDGWVDFARRQKTYLKTTYDYGPMVNSPDGKGKKCWEWIQATVHDSAAGEIPQTPVYLEEWYVDQRKKPAPWQNQTKHKFHIIAFRLAIREVYNLTGVVVDEDAAFYRGPQQGEQTDSRVDEMAKELSHFKTDVPVEYIEAEAESLAEDAKNIERNQMITNAEDAMVDAMAGEEPPAPEEERVADTPLLDSLQNVCSVPNCASQGMIRCQSCQEWFCMEHLSNNPELCLVCYGGE